MKRYAPLFFLCIILGACGGGSGDSGSTPNAGAGSGTPPSNLTYPNNNSETFVSGSSANSSPVSISGSPVITYSVSPALPNGLTLNSSTGVISGTPTAVQPATSYAITATNAAGSVSTSITIQVNGTSASGILRWTIIDNYGPGENIYVNFWDETIGNFAWPGSNLLFTATPGSNTYTLSCTLGDVICYGADPNTTEIGTYWGVDVLNDKPYQSCENDPAIPCCHPCSNASYSITLAN